MNEVPKPFVVDETILCRLFETRRYEKTPMKRHRYAIRLFNALYYCHPDIDKCRLYTKVEVELL